MDTHRENYSVSIGQGRIGAGIIAVSFAGVAIFLAWPWSTQAYQPKVVAFIAVNGLLSIIFVKQAGKRVTIREHDVIVANWNRTVRVPLSEVRAFSPHQPGRYSRISFKPVLERRDGRIIRLDALIPTLGTISLDADISAALRRLNHELSIRKIRSDGASASSDPVQGRDAPLSPDEEESG